MPTDATFLFWVAVLGFFSGIYFGWLPLCLPELFPTRVRSTGAGVELQLRPHRDRGDDLRHRRADGLFDGDYARIGRLTSLLFILGMVVIWLAPDTSELPSEPEA